MSDMDVDRAIAVARRPWQHTDAERDAAYRLLNAHDAEPCGCGCNDYGTLDPIVIVALGKLVAYNIMCTLATSSQKGL